MIILEGPDSSGKTTLAHALSETLGIPVHHFGGPPESAAELRERIDFMFDNKDFLIYDRIPLISEQVFSILRRQNYMNVLTNSNADHVRLQELKPILIYCRPSDELLMACNHQVSEHDTEDHIKAVEAHKKALLERYDHVMGSDLMPRYWKYDYTKMNVGGLITRVESTIKERNHYPQFHLGKRDNDQ